MYASIQYPTAQVPRYRGNCHCSIGVGTDCSLKAGCGDRECLLLDLTVCADVSPRVWVFRTLHFESSALRLSKINDDFTVVFFCFRINLVSKEFKDFREFKEFSEQLIPLNSLQNLLLPALSKHLPHKDSC